MKKKIVSFIVSLSLIVVFTSGAFASSKNRMIERLWERHQIGISNLITCWSSGGSTVTCKPYLEEVLTAEVGLLAYGISPKDPRLVCGIASEENVNLGRFVYELILRRFERYSGWRPSSTFPISWEINQKNKY